MSEVVTVSKYKPYPAYKDSGIKWLGQVPEHWKLTPLKFIAKLNPKKSEVAGNSTLECSFLPMEKLKTNSIILDETKLVEEVYSGYTYFRNGDVLLAKVTPCFENRNIAIAENLVNGIGFGSTEIYVLRAKDRDSNSFLYYRLQEQNFMNIAISQMTGAGGLKRVPSEFLESFSFGMPRADEQTQIANFLDSETRKIDTLIAKQQTLIGLLKEKRQAVISHAVTKGLNPNAKMKDSGIQWLGDIPEHWKTPEIKHIVTTPVTDGPHETPQFIDSGVPFISAEAVSKGVVNFQKKRGYISEELNRIYSQKYSPQRHDIYMVKSGATTGVTAIVETDDVFNIWSPLAVIRSNKQLANPYFVLNFMRSKEFQQAIELGWSFGTQQNIGMGVIENISVTLPPVEEQNEIADYLDTQTQKIDTLIDKSQQAIDLLKERKTALISAAVTGKIDVRGVAQ